MKKRILTMFLAFTLVIGMSTLIFADGVQLDDNIIVEDKYGDYIGGMSYSEYMEYLYGEDFANLNSIPGVVEEKLLSFTRYRQGDSRWSSHQLLNGTNTIGSHGCALTSTAMTLDYFGYSDNPVEVNDKLLPYQPANDGNMYWGNVPCAYSVSLVKANSVFYTTVDDAYDEIRGQIRLNRPVIIGLKKGTSTHFVAARGILETEYNPEQGTIDKKYIYIHDPAGKNYTQLEQYINDGYYVNRIVAYR
ncbi:MAG: hypothetical protein ACFWUA_01190 [Sporanaerobacter sp.]|jgi:uncharacterized protein YvpB|uniref:C39 family peptidase n=1 Tax=Sporanaerobacter sp. TaxID=2010183 RepID=UPI003A0FCA64